MTNKIIIIGIAILLFGVSVFLLIRPDDEKEILQEENNDVEQIEYDEIDVEKLKAFIIEVIETNREELTAYEHDRQLLEHQIFRLVYRERVFPGLSPEIRPIISEIVDEMY